jgi:hypothetical protein
MSAKVIEHITENLLKAKDQKSDSQKFANLGNVTTFGVAPEHNHGHEEKKK